MTPRHRAEMDQQPRPRSDSTPPAPGSWLLPMIWPRSIRAKLIRILIVSLALVAAQLVLLLSAQVSQYQHAARISRMVTVTLSVQDAVHQLQKERGLTNGYVSGGSQFHEPTLAQRRLTDAALAALATVINNPANADAGADAVRGAIVRLTDLDLVRSNVDNGTAQTGPTFAFYTNAIGALNGLRLGLDQTQDTALRQALEALYALADAKEYTGQERGLLTGIFAAGRFSTATYQQFALILGEKNAALADYDRFATGREQGWLTAVLHSPAATGSAGSEAVAIGATSGPVPGHVAADTWWNSMTTVVNDMHTVQQDVGSDATARAVALRDTAIRTLVLISLIALLAIGIELAIVIGASRSVIGPLRHLAGDADDVARRRLPEAVDAMQTAAELASTMAAARATRVTVPKRAGTEIRRMAAALDRVRQTALVLASEQAVIRRNTTLSLANLGRRNQNLVRRQLALISDFEREELDPSALANLFELDHLATRMRRNAESLLVLVGDVSPRPWSEPLPVSDVLRAALSEVEDYRRVALRRIDESYITGTAVTEIAHMLAELLENALSFSPPDMEVEIYGRRNGDGYLLAVVDAGVGMTEEAIATANARLRDEENYLIAPTRFLGHYVVGRLAKPLNITVRLTDSPVTGITARMTLPNELLTAKPPVTETTPAKAAPDRRLARIPPVSDAISLSVPAQPATPEVVWPTVDESESAGPAEPAHRTGPSTPTANAIPPQLRPPAADQPDRTAVERTKNGLVKRQRRTAAKPATGQHAEHARRRPVADPSLSDRTPEEIASMLASFQRGHQRGEQHDGAHALRTEQRGPFPPDRPGTKE